MIDNINLKYRIFKSKFIHILICVLAALTSVPLLAILGKVIFEGSKNFTWQFLTEPTPTTYKAMLALAAGESIPGGIANGIIGTILMLLMAVIIALPIGIMSGTFLAEKRGSTIANIISYITDMLQGTPSIIIGIIVYAWVVIPMKGYSAFAGGIALTIMMLPLIIRSTEEALKLLPVSLKEASLALGGSYAKTVIKVLLPSAFGSIFTGVLLAVSRVVGETAPLMFTALGCAAIQWQIDKPMASVPLLIWQFFNNPTLQPLVWSAALWLLIFVLILNITSKLIAKKWKIQ